MDTETGEMIVKRVSVPIGLEELMEGLVKEVLLKKPDDIYQFAARYFAHLLTIREKVPVNKIKTLRSAQTLKEKSDRPPLHTRPSKLLKQFSIRADSPLESPIISHKPKMHQRNELKFNKRRHTGPSTVLPNNQQLTIRRKYAKSVSGDTQKPVLESNNNNINKVNSIRERSVESTDRNRKTIKQKHENNNNTIKLPILTENITKVIENNNNNNNEKDDLIVVETINQNKEQITESDLSNNENKDADTDVEEENKIIKKISIESTKEELAKYTSDEEHSRKDDNSDNALKEENYFTNLAHTDNKSVKNETDSVGDVKDESLQFNDNKDENNVEKDSSTTVDQNNKESDNSVIVTDISAKENLQKNDNEVKNNNTKEEDNQKNEITKKESGSLSEVGDNLKQNKDELEDNNLQKDDSNILEINDNMVSTEKRTLKTGRTIDDEEISRVLLSSISNTENETSSTVDLNEIENFTKNISDDGEKIVTKLDTNEIKNDEEEIAVKVDNKEDGKKDKTVKDAGVKKTEGELSEDSLEFVEEKVEAGKLEANSSVTVTAAEKSHNLLVTQSSSKENEAGKIVDKKIDTIIKSESISTSKQFEKNDNATNNVNVEVTNSESKTLALNEQNEEHQKQDITSKVNESSKQTDESNNNKSETKLGDVTKTVEIKTTVPIDKETTFEKSRNESIEEKLIKDTTNEDNISLGDQKTDLDVPSLETDNSLIKSIDNKDNDKSVTLDLENNLTKSPESTVEVKTHLKKDEIKQKKSDLNKNAGNGVKTDKIVLKNIETDKKDNINESFKTTEDINDGLTKTASFDSYKLREEIKKIEDESKKDELNISFDSQDKESDIANKDIGKEHKRIKKDIELNQSVDIKANKLINNENLNKDDNVDSNNVDNEEQNLNDTDNKRILGKMSTFDVGDANGKSKIDTLFKNKLEKMSTVDVGSLEHMKNNKVDTKDEAIKQLVDIEDNNSIIKEKLNKDDNVGLNNVDNEKQNLNDTDNKKIIGKMSTFDVGDANGKSKTDTLVKNKFEKMSTVDDGSLEHIKNNKVNTKDETIKQLVDIKENNQINKEKPNKDDNVDLNNVDKDNKKILGKMSTFDVGDANGKSKTDTLVKNTLEKMSTVDVGSLEHIKNKKLDIKDKTIKQLVDIEKNNQINKDDNVDLNNVDNDNKKILGKMSTFDVGNTNGKSKTDTLDKNKLKEVSTVDVGRLEYKKNNEVDTEDVTIKQLVQAGTVEKSGSVNIENSDNKVKSTLKDSESKIFEKKLDESDAKENLQASALENKNIKEEKTTASDSFLLSNMDKVAKENNTKKLDNTDDKNTSTVTPENNTENIEDTIETINTTKRKANLVTDVIKVKDIKETTNVEKEIHYKNNIANYKEDAENYELKTDESQNRQKTAKKVDETTNDLTEKSKETLQSDNMDNKIIGGTKINDVEINKNVTDNKKEEKTQLSNETETISKQIETNKSVDNYEDDKTSTSENEKNLILLDTKEETVENQNRQKSKTSMNNTENTTATNKEIITSNDDITNNVTRSKRGVSFEEVPASSDAHITDNKNTAIVDIKDEDTDSKSSSSENNLVDRVAKNYVNYVIENDRFMLTDSDVSGIDEVDLETGDNETENSTELKSDELNIENSDHSNIDSPKNNRESLESEEDMGLNKSDKEDSKGTSKDKLINQTGLDKSGTEEIDAKDDNSGKTNEYIKVSMKTKDKLIKQIGLDKSGTEEKDENNEDIKGKQLIQIGLDESGTEIINNKNIIGVNNEDSKTSINNVKHKDKLTEETDINKANNKDIKTTINDSIQENNLTKISAEKADAKDDHIGENINNTNVDTDKKDLLQDTAENLINSTLQIAQTGLIEHKVKKFLNEFIDKEKSDTPVKETKKEVVEQIIEKKSISLLGNKTKSSDTTTTQPVNGLKKTTSFDSSKLREELKKIEDESKFTSFKSSFNPFMLHKEIEENTVNNNKSNDKLVITSMNFKKIVDAVLTIQGAWKRFKNRKDKANTADKPKVKEENSVKITREKREASDEKGDFLTAVHAATVIQKIWKGFRARKDLKSMKVGATTPSKFGSLKAVDQKSNSSLTETPEANVMKGEKENKEESVDSKYTLESNLEHHETTEDENAVQETEETRLFSADSTGSVNTVIFNDPKEEKSNHFQNDHYSSDVSHLLDEILDYPTAEEEYLLDNYQSKLLDKISGKEEENKFDDLQAYEKIVSPKRFQDLEQLRDEVNLPLVTKTVQNDKLLASERKLTRSLSSKLEILEEESSTAEDEADNDVTKNDKDDMGINKDAEKDDKLYTFCSEPTPVQGEKKIDGKPVSEYVDIIASNNSNTKDKIINKTDIEASKENVSEEVNETREVHETLVIPLPTEVKNKLKNDENYGKISNEPSLDDISSLLSIAGLDSRDIHDTVVVPINEQHVDSGRRQPISVQLCQTSDAETPMTSSPAPATDVTESSRNAQDPGKADLRTRADSSNDVARFDGSDSPPESMESEKRRKTDGGNMEAQAATKIQAGFRGYQVRKQLKIKNGSSDMTTSKKPTRTKTGGLDSSQNQSQKPEQIEEQSAVKIQAGIRGFLVRRRQKKNSSKKT